ncbi:MAG TPA: phosphoribosyltransferase, partial [Acidilobales archaeon]|nr:phosphoribosyltransferase [Acidilobales archaeon]
MLNKMLCGGNQMFLTLDWRDIELYTFKVAKKILSNGFRPEVIIGIMRGGYIVARILSDYLDIPGIGAIEIKFYKSIGEHGERPILTQPLTINVRDKRVLIADDVADSGRTLQVAVDLIKLYGAKEVRTAVLFVKPRSIFVPDF